MGEVLKAALVLLHGDEQGTRMDMQARDFAQHYLGGLHG